MTAHARAYFPRRHACGLCVRRARSAARATLLHRAILAAAQHAAPLSGDISRAHPRLKLKLKPISLGRHRIQRQLAQAFEILGSSLGLGDELDEVRELMSEERLYRFVLMQIISFLHIVFDILASSLGHWLLEGT